MQEYKWQENIATACVWKRNTNIGRIWCKKSNVFITHLNQRFSVLIFQGSERLSLICQLSLNTVMISVRESLTTKTRKYTRKKAWYQQMSYTLYVSFDFIFLVFLLLVVYFRIILIIIYNCFEDPICCLRRAILDRINCPTCMTCWAVTIPIS